MSETLLPETVAIIGSFKQEPVYEEVVNAWNTFTNAGLTVTSPKKAAIIKPGIDFVRFESDNPDLTDAQIQQIALHRILGADFVYAVIPGGRVGTTASNELGSIRNGNRPLYFSEYPNDLPVEVPKSHVS